jgi:hypothetical protein
MPESVALGMIPKDCEAEFAKEFHARFKHDCELRSAKGGAWLGVYGRKRWPEGQRRLMSAYIQGFAMRRGTSAK